MYASNRVAILLFIYLTLSILLFFANIAIIHQETCNIFLFLANTIAFGATKETVDMTKAKIIGAGLPTPVLEKQIEM